MSLFERPPPRLPSCPDIPNKGYLDALVRTLQAYFTQQNSAQRIGASALNFNIDTLPTEADLADLRSGDVYRDTTASNVLKVKP